MLAFHGSMCKNEQRFPSSTIHLKIVVPITQYKLFSCQNITYQPKRIYCPISFCWMFPCAMQKHQNTGACLCCTCKANFSNWGSILHLKPYVLVASYKSPFFYFIRSDDDICCLDLNYLSSTKCRPFM